MDLKLLRRTARSRLDERVWRYIESTADAKARPDHMQWDAINLTPHAFQSALRASTEIDLGGVVLKTPVIVSPTGAQGLCNPRSELETCLGAAQAGALYCYSAFASLRVEEFGVKAAGPWWAQVYSLRDRARTLEYVDRCVAAGASALILTVDHRGSAANVQFRDELRGRLPGRPGNFPGWGWDDLTAAISPNVQSEFIADLHQRAGLPVVVKGILDPRDARLAADSGAAGIFVSNHGRRQLDGVIPTALALPSIVDELGGQIPTYVDGGIRSSTDVLRALVLGASAVGIGRPVLWALAAGGAENVTILLDSLTDGLERRMVAMGIASFLKSYPST